MAIHKVKKEVSDGKKVKREATEHQVPCHNPGRSRSYKRKREPVSHFPDPETISSATERAKKIQANLSGKFPSFLKNMLRSHVSGGFWLGLPKKFCDLQMPKQDTEFVLENESGEKYRSKYLAEKVGLSAGWRGFSIAHKLLEGDVLVFHLTSPTKFEVYIARSKSSDQADGGTNLRNMKASAKKTDSCKKKKEVKVCVKKEPSKDNAERAEDKNKKFTATDQPENDSVDSGVFDGVRLSESTVDYKDVSSFEEFTVVINGLVIDFEFSNYVRTKYYELCRSQNSFLHERLIEGINCKLAAGVISETVNIADAVESSKSAASRECFLLWEKTLKAFEVLGMNVGFLRTRLRRLIGDPTESKLFRKVVLEKIVRADEQRKNLQAKLSEVKEVATKLGSAMEALMENGEIF